MFLFIKPFSGFLPHSQAASADNKDDVTRAYPVVYGTPGDLFEVYEKIDPQTGRGLISVFANAGGVYRYRIQAEPAGEPVVFGSALLYREQDGLWIELKTDRPTAAILFFSRPV